MRMNRTRIFVFWMVVVWGGGVFGRPEPPEMKGPSCLVSIALEDDSLEPGEALDATFILQVKSSFITAFNPFLTEQFPVFVRLRVLDDKGELVSELLSPTSFDQLPVPPSAAWQFFGRDSLLGHRFVFSANDQIPSMAFLKQPGRYRIQAQVLKQMLGQPLYYEGQLISERIAERWPLKNGTEIAVESDLVPFEVTAKREGTLEPIQLSKGASEYGLRLRISQSLGNEKSKPGEAYFWVTNTAEKPRVLARVLSYGDTYSLPLLWSERVMGDSYRELNLVMFASEREPQDYSSIYVELPRNGVCGRISSVPSEADLRPGTEIIAQMQGNMMGAPAPKVATEMLKRGRLTQAGLENCQILTNKDIIATSNRLHWAD